MHLFYILLFSLMVLFTYQYWSGFRQSVNWQFPIGLLILASLFLRGIWVPIVLFGLVGLFFHLHWAGNQQIIPWSPLGLLGIALVTALGVFVLSLWFLSLPRQGNSTLQGGTIPSYLEPWFTIEGQLVGKHHKHLYLLDFHAQTVDTLSLPPFYSFSPDMVLYWQKKHLLYLNNEQKLYPIRWAKPRQVLLDSPSKLQHPRGWQIDTLKQQLVTYEYVNRKGALAVNYRDTLGRFQGSDTLQIATQGYMSLNEEVVIKYNGEYYFLGDTMSDSTTNHQLKIGIFKLHKSAGDSLYQDTLLLDNSRAGSSIRLNPFSSYGRKTDTLLTPQGIRYTQLPPFLNPDSCKLEKQFPEIKDGYTAHRFLYTANQKPIAYYTSVGEHYLKQVDQGAYLALTLLDHRGKVLAQNLVPGYPFSASSVPLVLNNEIVLFEKYAGGQYARFDLRTLKRIDPPSFWQDFPEKVAREFRQSWLEVGFYLTILLTLFGLPLMSWWGLKGLPAAKQGTGKKSWYIVLVIYANLALIALGFQITLLNTYL